MKKNKVDLAIINGFQIDEDGLKNVQIIDMAKIEELGIKDSASFINGLLDAKNEKEFGDSNEDYVKGYKYGKTGEI